MEVEALVPRRTLWRRDDVPVCWRSGTRTWRRGDALDASLLIGYIAMYTRS